MGYERIRPDPPWLDQLAVALEPKWREAAETARRGLQEMFAAIEPHKTLISALPAISEQMRDQVRELIAAIGPRLDAQWEQAVPDNWRWVGTGEVDPILDLMQDLGTSLVWVPSAETLRRLLASRSKDPARRLVRFEGPILDDVETALRRRAPAELRELRLALRQAVAVHRRGYYAAAQALSAAAVTAAGEAYMVEPGAKLAALRKRHKDLDPKAVAIQDFRRAIIFKRTAEAVDGYRRNGPVPARFNRNASTHTVSSRQFTRANSIAALMLAVSVVREIERELVETSP